jgi:hypothetical protein
MDFSISEERFAVPPGPMPSPGWSNPAFPELYYITNQPASKIPFPDGFLGAWAQNEHRALMRYLKRNHVFKDGEDGEDYNVMIHSVTKIVHAFCTKEEDRKLIKPNRVRYFRKCLKDLSFWTDERVAKAVIAEGCRILSVTEPNPLYDPQTEQKIERERRLRKDVAREANENVRLAYPEGSKAVTPCWESPRMRFRKPSPLYPWDYPRTHGWEIVQNLDNAEIDQLLGKQVIARQREADWKAGTAEREKQDVIDKAEAERKMKEFNKAWEEKEAAQKEQKRQKEKAHQKEEARRKEEARQKEAREKELARQREAFEKEEARQKEATRETAAAPSQAPGAVSSRPRPAMHPVLPVIPLRARARQQKARTIDPKEAEEKVREL